MRVWEDIWNTNDIIKEVKVEEYLDVGGRLHEGDKEIGRISGWKNES